MPRTDIPAYTSRWSPTTSAKRAIADTGYNSACLSTAFLAAASKIASSTSSPSPRTSTFVNALLTRPPTADNGNDTNAENAPIPAACSLSFPSHFALDFSPSICN